MDNSTKQHLSLEPDGSRQFVLRHTADLDPLMDRIGDAHHVLLGEATHGTHEFYTWRTAISKRLITEKGFRFLAVEGDWPDCYRINRYIKGYADSDKQPADVLAGFDRWPTWMWANWEIAALVTWLKAHNTSLPANKRVGFYGLDVYSLWESLDSLMSYLSEYTDHDVLAYVKDAISCFQPYDANEHRYARAQHYQLDHSCQEAVIELLTAIRKRAPRYDHDPEASLNAEQNAVIAVNAERYYRHMLGFDVNTWNLRDRHMMDTLNRLLHFHGPDAKVIVWEHNTHIGDARYTDMVRTGDINVGQLVREEKGEADTVLVGFGTYQGRVIAGDNWGAPMAEKDIPQAKEGSIEALMHRQSAEDRLLILGHPDHEHPFSGYLPHRAIGVVYEPVYEKRGNYVPTVLNRRYECFVFIDETRALHPLHRQPDGAKIPETYPFTY